MIYLPNFFERYTASLRNVIHLSVAKNGLMPKHLENMRKIFIIEALLCPDFEEPTDIAEFTSKLLSAVYINKLAKGNSFEFDIRLNGRYMLNRKLYTALILNICRNSHKLSIYKKYEQIIIRAENCEKNSYNKIIKVMNSYSLFESKSKTALIVLNYTATNKKSKPPIIESSYNPFSPVNLFI